MNSFKKVLNLKSGNNSTQMLALQQEQKSTNEKSMKNSKS